MKKYKYKIPERVMNCFSEDITEVIYKGNVYERDVCYHLHQQGALEEYIVDEYLNKYEHVIKEDFIEVVTIVDLTKRKIELLLNDLQKFQEANIQTTDTLTMITISKTSYKEPLKYIINNDGKYFSVNNNAATGFKQDFTAQLNNKRQHLGDFDYEIKKVNIEKTFEDVYKWYYYRSDFENTSTSGAGVLTGWLTEKEVLPKAKDCELIRLNKNFRLKKDGNESN